MRSSLYRETPTFPDEGGVSKQTSPDWCAFCESWYPVDLKGSLNFLGPHILAFLHINQLLSLQSEMRSIDYSFPHLNGLGR